MELLKKSRAFLLLFVTFFFWGSVYVGGKLISDDVPAPLLGCLRCFVASFPLMLMARKHFGVKIDRADWKYFAGVGVMGYFLTIFLIQLGISLTGASMASLVNSVTPVGVTIFAALHLKEKITPTKVLCLVLALVGTFVITTGATGQGEMAGILVVLAAVVTWSVASVFMRQLTAKYPPILVTAYGRGAGRGHRPELRQHPGGALSGAGGLRAGPVHLDGQSGRAACQHLLPLLPSPAHVLCPAGHAAAERDLHPLLPGGIGAHLR